MQKKLGFTIIELITVVAITAILAIFAVPAYNTYLIESRRSDAINAMRSNQLAVENYILNNSVAPADAATGGLLTVSEAGFYNLSYARDATNLERYTITATAVSTKSQNGDTGCTTLKLMSETDFIFPKQCR